MSPLVTLFANIAKGLSLLNLSGLKGVSLFGESGLFTKGLTLLKTALGGLTGPVGLAIAAFVLLMATSEDFRNSIGTLLQTIWTLIAPVIDLVLEIVKIVIDTLLPICLDVLGTIGDAIAPVIDLISEILVAMKPVVDFLASVFITVVRSLRDTLEGIGIGLKDFFGGIRDIIKGIVEVVQGILEGDFKKIGHGLLTIFAGVLNAISGVVETVVNAITGVINQGIQFVWKLVASFVNSILRGVNKVLDFIGMSTISWQMGIEAPSIPKLSIPKAQVPAFASGGVVTGPTMGILGEAGRDEAVIPLDNSPQMRNFISEIVSAINNSKSAQDQPTVIKVFVGNEQLDEYIYKSQKRRDLRTNGG